MWFKIESFGYSLLCACALAASAERNWSATSLNESKLNCETDVLRLGCDVYSRLKIQFLVISCKMRPHSIPVNLLLYLSILGRPLACASNWFFSRLSPPVILFKEWAFVLKTMTNRREINLLAAHWMQAFETAVPQMGWMKLKKMEFSIDFNWMEQMFRFTWFHSADMKCSIWIQKNV